MDLREKIAGAIWQWLPDEMSPAIANNASLSAATAILQIPEIKEALDREECDCWLDEG